MVIQRWREHILWIDGLAALSAGVFALAARGFLARLYHLPIELITFIALVNLGYSTLGLTLATRRPHARPHAFIAGLSVANYLWACVCVILAVGYWKDASLLGIAHLVFEGAFVATLATLEWRRRHELAGRS